MQEYEETKQNTRAEDVPHEPQQPHEQEEGPGLGPAIGTIIIVAILVLGAFYFWGQKVGQTPEQDGAAQQTQQTESTTTDSVAEELRNISTSSDIQSVEQDLEETNLDQLDSELQQLEDELNNL